MTPDNASAAQRDQFEAAMRNRGWTDYDFERDENGYGFHDSRLAWFAWQAAHEQGRLAGLEECANDLAKLRAFAEAVMGDWPDVGGLDGFDLQALGEKHGLLEKLERVAPCCESCRCAEYETGAVECYRLTSVVRPDRAIAAPGAGKEGNHG